MLTSRALLLVSAYAIACIEVPKPQPMIAADAGETAPRDAGASIPTQTTTPGAPVDTAPPAVAISSPANGTAFARSVATITIQGTALDDVSVTTVEVSVGPNVWIPSTSDDFFRTWRLTSALPPGTTTIRARATDVAHRSTIAEVTVTRETGIDLEPPSLGIASPEDGISSTRQDITVAGIAADDTGISIVEVRVDGRSEFVPTETSDSYAAWRATVALAPGLENVIRVRVADLAGKTVEQTRRVTSTTVSDRDPPTLIVLTPQAGETVASETIAVTGSANDNFGIAKVEVRAGSTGPYVLAATTDNFVTWSAVVPIEHGANSIRVRATDTNELETVGTVAITNTFVSEWSESSRYELRLPAPRNRVVSLTLNRETLQEVIPESVRRTIVLLNLDPTTLMANILTTIKTACGANWSRRGFSPNCPSSWGTKERNMWRLLTMTPDNVKVKGTSIEQTEGLAEALSSIGLIDDFSTILGNALGIGRYQEIIDSTNVVAAIKDDLIKNHPNATLAGAIPLTMEDACTDMRELASRFGPQGNHPGFLDPHVATYSKVLMDTFEMSVDGTSNLTWYDGVAVSRGKEYIALLPSPTADVVTFDFTNTMSISGVTPNPTVNLTFAIKENASFLRAYTSGNGTAAPQQPNPPSRLGAGEAWTVSPWFLEYVMIDSTFRKYKNRAKYVKSHYDPLNLFRIAVVAVGADDSPSPKLPVIGPPLGWARFWTLWGLGNPPPAQFLWEMITEIAQIRLRDGGVAEGQGSVRFSMNNVSVGLTGAQIKTMVRPSLESQKSALASRLLGDFRRNNGAVDFYLKGTTRNLYLYFVHSSDPLPSSVYSYPKPGFFADPSLTMKESSTSAGTSGDSVHEKLRLSSTPRTVYMKDNRGDVYRLEIQAAAGESVAIAVSKKL